MSESPSAVQALETLPVMGILRGVTESSLLKVLESAALSGLKCIEITLNTPSVFELIKTAKANFQSDLVIGAGTVLCRDDAKRAHGAGAEFLVSPNFKDGIATYCNKNEVCYFAGALTPTEIERAWSETKAPIKVFPASVYGPGFFKEMKGPLSHIPLMAVGGVRRENVRQYFKAGAKAVAVGGSIFSEDRMRNGEFKAIKDDLSAILMEVQGELN